MKIETNTYYDSRVNTDIERFYQLSDSEQDLVINDAYELYNKTRKWAIDAGLYEGADVCYDRNLDMFRSYKNMTRCTSSQLISPSPLNRNWDDRILYAFIFDIYRRFNQKLIFFSSAIYRNSYPKDVILVIRGTYDYQMFKKQEPLDNDKIKFILNKSLNKNCPIREQIDSILYKNSKPFQVVENKTIYNEIEQYNKNVKLNRNKGITGICELDTNLVFYCLGYDEINPNIIISSQTCNYDYKKLNPNIEIVDMCPMNNSFSTHINDYPVRTYIFKPASFSEIVAFVVARRFPSN